MTRRPLYGLALCLLLMSGGPVASGWAQTSPLDIQAFGQSLHEAQRAHLWRVATWGGANVAGGLALVLASSRDEQNARWAFGAMSAGWGAVNIGIAAVGLATASAPEATYAATLSAERTLHDILLVNLGLNVAYASVGGAMVAAGYRDVSNPAAWRGYGASLIMQGAGLLGLDGIAFLASRTRLSRLLELTEPVSAHIGPTGVALTISL